MDGDQVMLVPMTNYPFAVSFISSVFYVLIYGPILVWVRTMMQQQQQFLCTHKLCLLFHLQQSRLYKFSLLQPLKRFWKLFILMGLLGEVV